jgi:hypothetical protein
MIHVILCDEEAIWSKLSDGYAVRELADRVNEIYRWV